MDLTELGFTKEEVLEKVIDRVCASVLSGVSYDEDGEAFERDSSFKRRMDAEVESRISAAVEALGDKFVAPRIGPMVENLCLQRTNSWGEKIGKPTTFVEYMTDRAEKYLEEPVDHNGKPKGRDSYNWTASTTRISYLVDQYLQYSIKTAMEGALKNANDAIAGGVAGAVKLALADVQAKLKVSVATKS